MLTETKKKIEAGEEVYIGIMGGTFDPIHYGHLSAAHAACEQLGLAEVVFLPTGTPAFKVDCEITPGDIRLAMCCAAVQGTNEFSVNATEVVRGGITYTAETLRQLSHEKHSLVRFVFILGADSAATLLRWRDQEALKTLAHYAIVTRAGQKVAPQTLKALQHAGYCFQVVEAQTPNISSTDIRAFVAAGKDISQLVPSHVNAIIRENHLYLSKTPDAGTEDALSDAFFQARKQELEKRVGKHRFQHCLGVAQTCEHVAQVYGVNVARARLAGILHDWDKNYNDEGIRQRANELGMKVDPFVYQALPRVLHAHTAAVALQQSFPCIPEEVLRAIDRHTVAACDMSDLDMVLYIADAIEPNRVYPEIDELRAKIGVVSLEELFLTIYEYWIIRMMQRNMQLHPNTVEVWNHYVQRAGVRTKETSE